MRFLFAIGLAVACASCSNAPAPAVATAAAASAPRQPGPVISRLVMRRQTIVVRAGTDGPTYSLETRRGEVVVPDSTADELAVRNPDLLHSIRTMETAVSWAGE